MKKLLSFLLVIVMLLTALPLGAFEFKASAETEGYYTYLVFNGDGVIDLNDVNHFARYLAGWDVEIF